MSTGISGLYKNTKGAKASLATHCVKILPQYFEDILSGIKTFEIRYNDCEYKVGDRLCLKESINGNYTGRETVREICYMIDDPMFCKEGYVVLGLKQCETDTNIGGKAESEQTHEMAWELCDIPKHPSITNCEQCGNKHCLAMYYAKRAFGVGYRKQSKGEWLVDAYKGDEIVRIPYIAYEHNEPYCSLCGTYALLDGKEDYVASKFCPNCGAKMEGGGADA